MTNARREWITKRAYTIWEEAGRPHGHDADHWEQAVRERDAFEGAVSSGEAKPANGLKPLIEISRKARTAKPETAKAKKKADGAAEKPVVAKSRSAKGATNTKPV